MHPATYFKHFSGDNYCLLCDTMVNQTFKWRNPKLKNEILYFNLVLLNGFPLYKGMSFNW